MWPKKTAAKLKKTELKILHNAMVDCEVTSTITNGVMTVEIHGKGRPLSSFTASQWPDEIVLPAATIMNLSPNSSGIKFVTWDGEQYVFRPTLESVTSDKRLMLIGNIKEPSASADSSPPDSVESPSLAECVYEKISKELYRVDLVYWAKLRAMQVSPNTLFGIQFAPAPPKLPGEFRAILGNYATALFYPEANEFPSDSNFAHWLEELASRTSQRVMESVDKVEASGLLASLRYHGLTSADMLQAVEDAIQKAIGFYLQQKSSATVLQRSAQAEDNNLDDWPPLRRQVEAYKQIKALMGGPHEGIPEDLIRKTIAQQLKIQPEDVTEEQIRVEVSRLLPVYPAITAISSAPSGGQETAPAHFGDAETREVKRRADLLADYKIATGNPSDKKIYEALNSPIHKPDFYR